MQRPGNARHTRLDVDLKIVQKNLIDTLEAIDCSGALWARGALRATAVEMTVALPDLPVAEKWEPERCGVIVAGMARSVFIARTDPRLAEAEIANIRRVLPKAFAMTCEAVKAAAPKTKAAA